MVDFVSRLSSWYQTNARDFPFRRTIDPYLIWLSEIIMQQTRIEQGVPYYNRFAEVFPTIHDLAGASEEEVLKQWQGLGYYSRARNLHTTANEIVEKYDGKFPSTYEGLRALKGIGDYTAAAIASVCFGLPHPVMDGNVIRFITRHFGITGPVDQSAVKKEIMDVLERLMECANDAGCRMQDKELCSDTGFRMQDFPHPASGNFNQSIIEFGATYCVPRNPQCNECIFNDSCYALKYGMVDKLPLKKQQQPLKPRYFHYLVIQVRGKKGMYFRKRTGNDILKGMYEFPVIETTKTINLPRLMNSPEWKQLFGTSQVKIISQSTQVSQLLSHQKINARFYTIEIEKTSERLGNFISPERIHELPVARIIEKYLAAGG
ncbi:MAG: A/G-specific adenine glycosylase [Bacteroidota bacterium]